MIVIDNHGIMRSFSATAERLFGYVTDEAVGNNVSMLMPSPYREQHDSYLARYLRDRREEGDRPSAASSWGSAKTAPPSRWSWRLVR